MNWLKKIFVFKTMKNNRNIKTCLMKYKTITYYWNKLIICRDSCDI